MSIFSIIIVTALAVYCLICWLIVHDIFLRILADKELTKDEKAFLLLRCFLAPLILPFSLSGANKEMRKRREFTDSLNSKDGSAADKIKEFLKSGNPPKGSKGFSGQIRMVLGKDKDGKLTFIDSSQSGSPLPPGIDIHSILKAMSESQGGGSFFDKKYISDILKKYDLIKLESHMDDGPFMTQVLTEFLSNKKEDECPELHWMLVNYNDNFTPSMTPPNPMKDMMDRMRDSDDD